MSDNRYTGETKVVERAKKDAAFRSQLMSNPKAAVAAETGWQIPDNVTVKVVEESADTFYLVIPFSSEGSELGDEQLEDVAGGSRTRCSNIQTWTCVCTG
ncbi:MAG TPA: NHLP leader peptide family RiPP precursor [Aggregatilineales bacterium]|nr:NHLP leader peptide family natural product precursor [Anaerolineales bacterium]HRE48867.1 NHLP leader peptide family RiPP precursor [Aggregatilineales bacterium]